MTTDDENFINDDSIPGVFHIDLTEMKSLKFFFKEDTTSGHFVVGNHENHYNNENHYCFILIWAE
jgi:hypothetical protein